MIKKILVNICRFVFAAVFIFSGFVKAIDPLGFTYKMEDYLTAFGPFFETFTFFAFPLSILLSAIEFWIGFNLLFGIFRKKTTIVGMLFMAFMLPLTLYTAIFNPVPDCGCFGDALKITNWETFSKNVVFSAMAVILFIYRDEITPVFSKKTRWLATAYAFVFIVCLSIYCYRNLPIIDFRPYKIGNNIQEGMEIPADAPRDEYEFTFIYEKDGVQQEFNLDNYPAGDSTWKFVDSKNKLIKKGYEPPIHDFTISLLPDGEDITYEVLEDDNYTFLIISYKLEKASLKNIQAFNEVYNYAQENGYEFYGLNASLANDIEDFKQITKAEYPMAITDATTLKTIIRSNPGLVLIKNGTIINKWHYRNIPEFNEPLENSELGQIPAPTATCRTIWAGIICFLPLLPLYCLDRFLNRKK
jgi:uncharacterized membrane protein YphA (DoxX/SURF4 family)